MFQIALLIKIMKKNNIPLIAKESKGEACCAQFIEIALIEVPSRFLLALKIYGRKLFKVILMTPL